MTNCAKPSLTCGNFSKKSGRQVTACRGCTPAAAASSESPRRTHVTQPAKMQHVADAAALDVPHRRRGQSDVMTIRLIAVAVMTMTIISSGVHAQYTTNLTTDEWAYCAAVGASVRAVVDTNTITVARPRTNNWINLVFADNAGKLYGTPFYADTVLIIDPVTNTTDSTTLAVGLGSVIQEWHSMTYAPNVGKLFAAPWIADAVLIIDPLTNTTDNTTLSGLGFGGGKWVGIAYADNVGKLYGAPDTASAVLIIDPVANTTDMTTLAGLGNAIGKWYSITYAANVGKLYAAPYSADAVLIIDPVANTTDATALAGLASGGNKWRGITFVDIVGKLYAAPFNANAVLIIDPVANTTDTTTLAGLGSATNKWVGIAYASNVEKLFAAPLNANSVLIIDPVANTTDNTTLAGESLGSTSGNRWHDMAYEPPTLFVNNDAFVNTARLHTHVPFERSWYDSYQHGSDAFVNTARLHTHTHTLTHTHTHTHILASSITTTTTTTTLTSLLLVHGPLHNHVPNRIISFIWHQGRRVVQHTAHEHSTDQRIQLHNAPFV
jgi:hypothetical protein